MLFRSLDDSLITYINSTDASMICNRLSESELLCSGDAAAIADSYTTVTYVCTSDQLLSHPLQLLTNSKIFL